MKRGVNLDVPVALQVSKTVTRSFGLLVPESGPLARVLEGSNCQNNAKKSK